MQNAVLPNYDPVDRCIYCDALKCFDGTPLTKEHIISEGMGGDRVLPSASCDKCRDITSLFERYFMQDMHWPTRAYWNLYGKRRKRTRPNTLEVRLDDNTRSVHVPIDEYPYALFMPLLAAPGILLGRDPRLETCPQLPFPELTHDRVWQWHSSEAPARADALLEKYGANNLAAPQKLYLVEFFKLIAKVAHSYAVAEKGYNPFTTYLLRGLIRAPKGLATHGAPYLVGRAFDPGGAVFVPPPSDALHRLWLNVHMLGDYTEVTTVRVQLFAWLGTPVYEAIVYQSPSMLGQQFRSRSRR